MDSLRSWKKLVTKLFNILWKDYKSSPIWMCFIIWDSILSVSSVSSLWKIKGEKSITLLILDPRCEMQGFWIREWWETESLLDFAPPHVTFHTVTSRTYAVLKEARTPSLLNTTSIPSATYGSLPFPSLPR